MFSPPEIPLPICYSASLQLRAPANEDSVQFRLNAHLFFLKVSQVSFFCLLFCLHNTCRLLIFTLEDALKKILTPKLITLGRLKSEAPLIGAEAGRWENLPIDSSFCSDVASKKCSWNTGLDFQILLWSLVHLPASFSGAQALPSPGLPGTWWASLSRSPTPSSSIQLPAISNQAHGYLPIHGWDSGSNQPCHTIPRSWALWCHLCHFQNVSHPSSIVWQKCYARFTLILSLSGWGFNQSVCMLCLFIHKVYS